MAFFGLFGNKPPQQPGQPASGGIETGIPAGVPQQTSNPNTLGGLMPAAPAPEQPAASGNLEETGTWAAKKSEFDAEKSAETPLSSSPIVPPGANEHLDMASGTTPPLSTYGAPSPASVEASTPLVSTPLETPADQFSQPVSEVTETKTPDTEPSSEPAMETQAPVSAPVAESVEPPKPPPFSMDAITNPQPKAPVPSDEPTEGELSPTNPNLTEAPSATIPPGPAHPVDVSAPAIEPVSGGVPDEPVADVVSAEPPTTEPIAEAPEGAKIDGNNGLEPLGNAATAAPEPLNMPIQHKDSPDEHAVEPPPAEGESALKLVPTPENENPVEEKPDNIVQFPGSVETPKEPEQPAPPDPVAQTEPSPTELPQAA